MVFLFLKKVKHLTLEYIYIKKEYRNSGLGSKLLNFALYELINLGYKEIVIEKFKAYEIFEKIIL